MKKDYFTNLFMGAINWDKVRENEEVIEKILNKDEKKSANDDSKNEKNN